MNPFMKAAVAGILAGRNATVFDPASTSPSAAYVLPNYDNTSRTWTATTGSNIVSVATDPGDISALTDGGGGYPDFDWSGSAIGNLHLQSSGFPLSTWGPGVSGTADYHLFASIVIENNIPNISATPWASTGVLMDSGNWTGLHLRRDTVGGTQYACMYAWDSSGKVAEVDITSVLSGGVGALVFQGKLQSGNLYVKIGTGAWSSATALPGAVGALTGQFRVGWNYNGKIKAAYSWTRALTDTEADNMAIWGASL